MDDLREQLIRLAYQKPHLREKLLPLVRTKHAGWSMNAKSTPVDKAAAHAEEVFQKAGTSLNEVWPDFERNYKLLQKKLGKAKKIPRILMPVIEPSDMQGFTQALSTGRIDIFKPWARGKLFTPENFSSKTDAEEWVELGFVDGHETDDVVRAKKTKMPAGKLLPTQDQIWFDKIVKSTAKFGPVTSGSPVLGMTVIVSKEGYILDGHHRFASTLLSDPSLGMDALFVPLGIDLLLEIGRTYGLAIGNRPKA